MMRIPKLIVFTVILFFPILMHGQVSHASISHRAHINQSEIISVYDFNAVDESPEFPGGQRGLINFINKVREYPYEAYVNRIEGRVLCSFVITPDGNICDIRIIKGVEQSLDREAIRIIQSMPKWQAGRIGSENVAVRCIMPIVFRR